MNRVALSAPVAALVLALIAAPGAAEDARLVKLAYDPARVVHVEGRANVQATIAFADDEVIENVAVGDSQKWQVTPNKRATILFVKPLTPSAATNMTVITSKRTYLFDLVASPRTKPVYMLSFSYPKEEKAQQEQLAAAAASEAELAAAAQPEAIVDPAELNFAWQGKGSTNLLPARSYDDGQMTYLSWPAGKEIPAILIKNLEGIEGPVNFTVRGDVIVVDGVPREIVLRAGKDVATLVNTGSEGVPAAGRGDTALAANMESK